MGDGTYHSFDSFLFFGDNAAGTDSAIDTDGLTCEIDYIAFELGAVHTPEPATLIVMLSGMAVCLLAKRR